MPEETALPLHVVFNAAKLGANPTTVSIKPDAAACKAIADYLDIVALERLHAVLHVRRWRKHGAMVEGVVNAAIEQQCVVTLKSIRTEISEPVKVRLLPAKLLQPKNDAGEEIVIDPLAEDPPEAFDGREIDLGALALEHLALGIDAYPRAAGAALPEIFAAAEPETPAKISPFQILAQLRNKLDG